MKTLLERMEMLKHLSERLQKELEAGLLHAEDEDALALAPDLVGAMTGLGEVRDGIDRAIEKLQA